jgi:hypothetical protein
MRRALALLVIAACSGRGPREIGAEPSWRHGTASVTTPAPPPVTTFAPAGPAVTRYNDGLRAPAPSVLGDATLAAVRDAAQKAGMPPPIADARLFKACEELAQIVPEDGVVSYSAVEFALQRNGII